ncbi:hypothetical protein Musp01_28600 [Muricauda sp. NBRC 101325]|nr:hypothetical protein Musp01_28600 [Muricauda sp. NBRC 101325]
MKKRNFALVTLAGTRRYLNHVFLLWEKHTSQGSTKKGKGISIVNIMPKWTEGAIGEWKTLSSTNGT